MVRILRALARLYERFVDIKSGHDKPGDLFLSINPGPTVMPRIDDEVAR